jgi:hypothetical protein
VNGRALVSGLQLASMEFDDMLDVLHFFFEDDMDFSTAEQAEARDKTRSSVYQNLYNRTYKYARTGGTTRDFSEVENIDTPQEAPIEPFNPAVKPKPYVAPTQLNPDSPRPFGSVLDAPFER